MTYQQVAIDADATYAPLSAAGNRPPAVRFKLLSPTVLVAHPPGASIRCELEEWDCSHVVIRSTLREHIARVTVHPEHGHDDITEETIAIASALYWSWWRAQDMRGCAPTS